MVAENRICQIGMWWNVIGPYLQVMNITACKRITSGKCSRNQYFELFNFMPSLLSDSIGPSLATLAKC